MFASVIDLLCIEPFKKRYLPSVSINESVILKGQFLATRIETPFVLCKGLGACVTYGNWALVSFGILLERKCVSCRKIMLALSLCMVRRSLDRFSGVLSPFTLRETILSVVSFIFVVVCVLRVLFKFILRRGVGCGREFKAMRVVVWVKRVGKAFKEVGKGGAGTMWCSGHLNRCPEPQGYIRRYKSVGLYWDLQLGVGCNLCDHCVGVGLTVERNSLLDKSEMKKE